MICVCIGRGRHKQMIAEHAHLVEQGAKLVELRLDYIAGDVNLKRILENRPGPVIISCRRQEDGGKWSRTEAERQVLLRSAIASGVEYVDLEEDIADDVPRYGNTKRIVSLHDFHKTPADLAAVHARLAAKSADIVKIATMANNPSDNVRMLNLIASSEVPTVGMCMGDMGMPTRILAGCFGAPFTYATFHHERALAPGQLSYKQMTEIYHYESINEQTEVFGVIADPIGHSLSPVIHNAAFVDGGMNRVYVPFRVPREHLHQFIEDCSRMRIKGLSVTIPHKEAVLKQCTKVDRAVAGIGAANTLLFQDGQIIGHNTDHAAAMDSLMKAMKLPASETPFVGKTAMVLGAGGAAKAIAFGLTHRGANVIVAARSPEKAKFFADHFKCRIIEWENRHSVNADILVNCTPLGMHPNVDDTPYDRHHLRPSMVVFDTVYNPEQTLLLKQAREKHCLTVTGVEMFVRQAAIQFHYFTGEAAPAELMRETLKRTIGAIRYA
ncbi:MAG: shikimate dehydrogenase [Planctomycetales bacterium]|nr:shikimate dehydrogenase [Planctomycetales bacterium]MCA9168216.1 shikimate dehydrogenase [Planctomycetales bacterium]